MAEKIAVVTGGAGFVGSHLCKQLVEEGYRVISLDNYFTGMSENHVEGVEYREGHTKDIDALIPESPDLLYHLGEYSRVEQSVLEAELVYDLNVVGTAGVLEFWQKHRCKLVYAGSSTKFGDGGLARHTSPYASTKAENTERVKQMGQELGLPYAITYFYNVFGPGERSGIYGTVVETFKQTYLSGMPMAVTAPGTQKRNFTHVEDIVRGLILVGEKGEGDEYGLGNDQEFTILELARLFGGDIVMMPERKASRNESSLHTEKTRALGWLPTRTLAAYVEEFKRTHDRGRQKEKRVLVYSTTFFPIAGPAEEALYELMERLPRVHFDVVTSAFAKDLPRVPLKNVTVHRVGRGRPTDKYLLPLLGYRLGRKLHKKHSYLFIWGLMASYGSIAALLLKWRTKVPFLVTLADQDLRQASMFAHAILPLILNGADQVYGIDLAQEKHASWLRNNMPLRRSIGAGDAFANQLRYAYVDILLKKLHI